ncbi:MAG: HipA domain-containing protein [Oligoflexia bacterium]|nr:HipA domain-containing protein [Oligoflexia bacterium]
MNCLKCKKNIKKASFYGLHANCFMDWFNLSQFLEFSDLDPKNNYTSNHSITKMKSFYHGQYRKYSARLNSIQYILKVQEPQYPDLPSVEYLCNKIADLLNLQVPKYYLIRYSEEDEVGSNKQELLTFVTRNFTQDYVGALHHIYKFLPKGKKHYNCENIIGVIKEQTKSLNDVERFVKIGLFDAFTGNNDRHGRNLGIIDTGRSKKLAPMYDNPSYFGVEDERLLMADFNISCAIRTSTVKGPKLLDYVQEFKSLELGKVCLSFIKKIINKYPLILTEVENSEISQNRKKAFINFLSARLKDCKQSIEEGI